MRPSSTMSFEPGLDRGVPWGRDLFTFVTSAAGHMMRTLQKPRKNRPSKRQVNHRRFLHNMIQRKFAEIEAANQQLTTALFSADTAQSQSEMKSSHKREAKTMKKATADSCETETPTKQQDECKDCRIVAVNPETGFLKSKTQNHPENGEGNQTWEGVEQLEHNQENSPQQTTGFSCEREDIQSTTADLDNLAQVTNVILEESVLSWLESIERRRQNSDVDAYRSPDIEQQYLGIALFDMSPTSAEVSPLSLDSCDFEEMRPHGDHSSEIEHFTESLQVDVMENLALLDSTEGYLQSHHSDQRLMAGVWHVQSEEEQSCFQDSLTLINTSHEGYVMDSQTDSADGVITVGLDDGPHDTMLQESAVKLLNAEHDLTGAVACSLAPCGSSFHPFQTRYATRQTSLSKDCYPSQPEPDIHITISKEGQYSAAWSLSEKNLELGNFLSHSIDDQALLTLEHCHPNQALTKYWNQHDVHQDHTESMLIEPYYVLTDAEKNVIQPDTTLHPDSVYDCPPNLQCCDFGLPPQVSSKCRGDASLYLNGEDDGSVPSFEGVAQSFPAPMYKLHPQPVSTPPLNDDWLFSNIVAEMEFTGVVRPAEFTYC